ncbi:PilZ domain-containing protein [Nitrospiraceae bacterium HYJII51-Mn-bac16s-1-B09]|uniref:PilZ domain-containing protein n=2 Tax=Candidatus Manganitrophus noduliformans TaxID=2606439 RepID=A0A7X6DPI1_9BACT|nr:PilZ domain-containing protein [Candidatus Manganitrophus noduliformans]
MTGWVEIWGQGADDTLSGYVSNVSLGGIAVYTKEILSPGTTVLITIHFFGKQRLESVRAIRGEVVSSLKLDKNFQLGIRFLEPISKENGSALFTYLTE